MAAFREACLRSMRHAQNEATLWNGVNVTGSDVTSRETLLALAKMTNNAYFAGTMWKCKWSPMRETVPVHESVAVVHPRWLGIVRRRSLGPHVHLRRQH